MNKPGRNNSTCKECSLYIGCSSPFMQPDGAKHPKVLVIGEAPGEEEDKQGIPFVGRSGQLLRTAIDGIGFAVDDVAYTNVVRCRPPDNKISKNAINYCKGFAIQELEDFKLGLFFLLG